MKVVVDTNILFSFFKRDSKTRELILNFEYVESYTPSFCINELLKYKDVICEKSLLDNKQFDEVFKYLLLFVKVVPFDEYKQFLSKAIKISPDPDDVDLFALALKLNCSIWSNDKVMKRQSSVEILSTKEILEFLSKTRA